MKKLLVLVVLLCALIPAAVPAQLAVDFSRTYVSASTPLIINPASRCSYWTVVSRGGDSWFSIWRGETDKGLPTVSGTGSTAATDTLVWVPAGGSVYVFCRGGDWLYLIRPSGAEVGVMAE